jgi:hypothetical protein
MLLYKRYYALYLLQVCVTSTFGITQKFARICFYLQLFILYLITSHISAGSKRALWQSSSGFEPNRMLYACCRATMIVIALVSCRTLERKQGNFMTTVCEHYNNFTLLAGSIVSCITSIFILILWKFLKNVVWTSVMNARCSCLSALEVLMLQRPRATVAVCTDGISADTAEMWSGNGSSFSRCLGSDSRKCPRVPRHTWRSTCTQPSGLDPR